MSEGWPTSFLCRKRGSLLDLSPEEEIEVRIDVDIPGDGWLNLHDFWCIDFDKMAEAQDNFIRLATCPVCGSPSLAPYKKRTFDYRSLHQDQVKITDSEYGKIWDLDRCENCTHVFANPCPSPDFIDSLYGEVEDPDYEEEAEGRSKNFRDILVAIEKYQPEKGNLFDVGAATGILLNLARNRGWHAEGIEASRWAVDLAKKRYNLDISLGSFGSHPIRPDHYSAVTMIDFIEHIPNPSDAAGRAHQILDPEGILCLVTPDIESLAARISGGRWWHFRPGHLSYFTMRSVITLLKKSGFRVKALKRYSWTFSVHYLLSRKDSFRTMLDDPSLALFFKKIPIKLALRDSLEIYAVKDRKE